MKWGLVLALSAFALLVVGSAKAAPGVLDPSFGTGSGEVTTPIGTSAARMRSWFSLTGRSWWPEVLFSRTAPRISPSLATSPTGRSIRRSAVPESCRARRDASAVALTAGRQDRRGRNGVQPDQSRSVQHGRLARPELRQRRGCHDSGRRVRFRRQGARAAARREDRGRRRQLRRLRDAVRARPVRRERLARRDVRQRRGRHHAGRGRQQLSRLPRSTAGREDRRRRRCGEQLSWPSQG